MKIATICRLSDKKLSSKIKPLIEDNRISKIYLIRRNQLDGKKLQCFCPPGIMKKNIVLSEIYRETVLIFLCLVKRPDGLLAYYFVPHGIYTAVSGKVFSIKTIQILTGSDANLVIKSKFFFWLLKSAELIGVRGVNTMRSLVRKGIPREKIFIPPNIFDFSRFKPQHQNKFYDIIYVGGFVREKRLDIFLKVIAEIKKRRNIRVVLLGDGYLMGELKKIAYQLEIQEDVNFVGHRDNVAKWLNLSKIFVMTSEIEGLPMAMIEAMSCGLPVIVPDVGDITAVARDGYNSIVVPPLNIDRFVKALISLLEDQEFYNRLSKNAVKIREEHAYEYSLENTAEIWNKVLMRLNNPNTL